MGIREQIDQVVATNTGQTVGWVLVVAIVLGFFSRAGSDVTFLATVVALGLSWMLGASYGRHHASTEADQEEEISPE